LLLEAKDISVNYGAVKALEGLSFNVGEGEIVAMIGPNGAGKSTALKAVGGLLSANGGTIENGEILLEGASIRGLRTDQLVEKGVVLVPEGRRAFGSMTVEENLEMGGYQRNDKGGHAADMEKVYELFPRLAERRRQRAQTLSTGEQQMLAMGRGLMARPKLLLADEPSLGLSPNFCELVFEKLTEINRAGTSILLVEQNAAGALRVAHRAYVFSIGRIALHGTSEELLGDEKVKNSFLGR
jgi:branched-chain amino acid transport system ATP-binding protein